MNEEEVKKQIDQAASDSQYNIAPVSFHTHNGTDSPTIDLTQQSGNTSLVVGSGTAQTGALILAAGANTTVSQSGKTFTVAVPTIGLTTAYDYQEFTTTGAGTWTKPAGATAHSMVYVEAWGGGGGSGNANNAGATNSGAGGGAECAEGEFRASDLNTTVSLTVGAGGTAGVGAGGNGGTGGTTSFGTTLVVANGGVGGQSSSAGAGTGGAGGGYFPGLATSGTPNARDPFSGGAGANNLSGNNGGNAYKGGGGGGSGTGGVGGTSAQGGAGATPPSGNGVGVPGIAPGGGASSANQNGAGSKDGAIGGRGEIRIWTYF